MDEEGPPAEALLLNFDLHHRLRKRLPLRQLIAMEVSQRDHKRLSLVFSSQGASSLIAYNEDEDGESLETTYNLVFPTVDDRNDFQADLLTAHKRTMAAVDTELAQGACMWSQARERGCVAYAATPLASPRRPRPGCAVGRAARQWQDEGGAAVHAQQDDVCAPHGRPQAHAIPRIHHHQRRRGQGDHAAAICDARADAAVATGRRGARRRERAHWQRGSYGGYRCQWRAWRASRSKGAIGDVRWDRGPCRTRWQ